jgi:hypothetical protein
MWESGGPQSGARFGYSVAGNFDVNDDGVSDLLIGAPFVSYFATENGEALLYKHGKFI